MMGHQEHFSWIQLNTSGLEILDGGTESFMVESVAPNNTFRAGHMSV